MDLRSIRYFVAVAEEGSVTHGARRVHISQPAVSRQLAALEHEIGTDLFERGYGAIRLTHAGRRFLDMAYDLLHRADSMKSSLANPDPSDLRLTVIAQATTIERAIIPFTALSGASYPLIDAVAAKPTQIFETVETMKADLGISAFPPPLSWCSKVMAAVGLTVQVPLGHPLAGRTSADIEEVVRYSLIVMDTYHAARTCFDEAVAKVHTEPVKYLELSSTGLAQAHAAAGRGVAILTDRPQFGLQGVPITAGGAPVQMRLYAGWAPKHFAEQVMTDWVEVLAEWMQTIPNIRHVSQDLEPER